MLPGAAAWPPPTPPPVGRRRAGLLVGLVVGALVIGLVASGLVLIAIRSNSAEGAWLSSDSSGAILLQITDADGQLAGSAQTWRPDDDLGSTGASESFSLTGLRSNDSLSISLAGALGTSLTWTGALQGDELTLQIASDDGGLRSAVFRRSTVDDYNTAVLAGQRASEERREGAQREDEAAAERERVAEHVSESALAEEQVAADLRRLDQVIDDLDGVDLQPQIDEMERRLEAMQGQLDTVRTTSECVAQSDALVALGDGLVALSDAQVAFHDARRGADEAIGRGEAAIDDLDKHLLDLEAAIGRAGPSAPPTTSSDQTIARREAALSSMEEVAAHVDESDAAAADLFARGEAVLDQGNDAIRSCSAGPPGLTPTVPGAPLAPNAPESP